MIVLINNRPATVKKDSSIEYVSENRLFSGSDGYTLSITFPMRGCNDNLEIFGHINRADVAAQKVIFDCELRDGSFCKSGSITITEISESEVKAQFLEGRSEQNFDRTFSDIYINELSLGLQPDIAPANITPHAAWDPEGRNFESVALPWWNNSSDGLAHNFSAGIWAWADTTTDLTWQPYLLFIVKKICEAVGYTYDFSRWEADPKAKYLLVCNTLPGAWDVRDYARALPHWTVDEFFEKLEIFLNGEFNIDHREQKVSFVYTNEELLDTKPVVLDNVINDYSVEVKVEDDRCDYVGLKNYVYKLGDDETAKYDSCDWFIKESKNNIVRYDTLTELLNANRSLRYWNGQNSRGSNINKVLYAADVDTHFIVRPVSREANGKDHFGHQLYKYTCILQPINTLGGRIVDADEDAEEVEIEFVPVRIDHTEDKYGFCMFLSFSNFAESSGGYREDFDWDAFQETAPQSMIKSGEKDQKPEYYNCIYIGYWDGINPTPSLLPTPHLTDIVIHQDWSGYVHTGFSLRLNSVLSETSQMLYRIDPKRKTNFKFICDKIPNVRAVFYIRGKRYLCGKITATFTSRGMSQLLKGEFYPLDEEEADDSL